VPAKPVYEETTGLISGELALATWRLKALEKPWLD